MDVDEYRKEDACVVFIAKPKMTLVPIRMGSTKVLTPEHSCSPAVQKRSTVKTPKSNKTGMPMKPLR
jgi:hypothetical protein